MCVSGFCLTVSHGVFAGTLASCPPSSSTSSKKVEGKVLVNV